MPADETLIKLIDKGLKQDFICADSGAEVGSPSDALFRAAKKKLSGLTDVYILWSKYHPYEDVQSRLLTREQHTLAVKHLKSKESMKGAQFQCMIIAMNLKPEETPAELAEADGHDRVVLGVF